MIELLDVNKSLLMVIDIQDKFRPILFNPDQVVLGTQKMITGCNQLNVPVIVTEQYPKGLGVTVVELKQVIKEDVPFFEKTSFGCCQDTVIEEQLALLNRKQIMICGIEAHVCVNQTVIDLLKKNYQVYLIEDAIGSRNENNYKIALKKMAQAGAVPSCIEMALFELMRSSKHPQFKEVQKIIL